jgi:hypothetical protein
MKPNPKIRNPRTGNKKMYLIFNLLTEGTCCCISRFFYVGSNNNNSLRVDFKKNFFRFVFKDWVMKVF